MRALKCQLHFLRNGKELMTTNFGRHLGEGWSKVMHFKIMEHKREEKPYRTWERKLTKIKRKRK